MNWTIASDELYNNQTQIRDFDINELTIRGGFPFINLSQLGTSTI